MNSFSAIRQVLALAFALTSSAGCRSERSSDDNEKDHSATSDSAGPTDHETGVHLTPAQIAMGGIKWELPVAAATDVTAEVPGQLVVNDDRTARVSAPAEARALSVHVSPGQRIARGAALVTLQSQDANLARADVAKAQAEVASTQSAASYARAARDRAAKLLELKAIPRQDYERAIADYELAVSALSQARSELIRARAAAQQLGLDVRTGTMILRAPLSGVVVSRDIAPGAVVMPGTPLVTITDPSSLWLAVSMPERLSGGVRTGSTVRFSVAALPADSFVGRVQSVGAAFDEATRSLPVRALVDNRLGRLRPQMYAKVWVSTGQSTTHLTVPDGAIQRADGKPVVFVARPDQGGVRFEQREVEVLRAGDRWAILRGVSPGENIVTQGAFAVKAELEKGSMSEMAH